MSGFGDFDDDDAFDVAPADPEQVAVKIHALLLEAGVELTPWDELGDERRAIRVALAVRLLAWLRRQGAT